ncbi:hypothetical protein [Hymenobacter psychrophilus]|uniref:Uncharacterized protein n=1 Tax=Hymenobacter psychrophilus TaxID=651662 RepID=A0A1H3FH45_9BACT|nr:hypothetical protein [Hymenobacter psychrophilus]SDX90362.1 hypothetical protein SAMN04488069_10476 [Hymenobacter psychrophilus]
MFLLAALLSLTTPLPPPGSGPTDSLIIFNANRTYHYRAVFISPTGDTLSRERVTLQPSGEPWIAQKKVQTAFRVIFNNSPQDSATFSVRLNPESKGPDKPKRYNWIKSYTTGAKEDKQEVWIHPIRDNQYNYTEVAPFPEVKQDSLVAGLGWGGKMVFLFQGAFNGKATNRYQVEKQETRQYGALSLPGCWLIKAVGEHSKLGKSYLDFYFHPQYGFTEMHYRFYDGTKIDFVLEQVLDKRQP